MKIAFPKTAIAVLAMCKNRIICIVVVINFDIFNVKISLVVVVIIHYTVYEEKVCGCLCFLFPSSLFLLGYFCFDYSYVNRNRLNRGLVGVFFFKNIVITMYSIYICWSLAVIMDAVHLCEIKIVSYAHIFNWLQKNQTTWSIENLCLGDDEWSPKKIASKIYIFSVYIKHTNQLDY